MKIKKKTDFRELILCSAAAAFAFFVYAPYNIYFPNAEEFTFTFYDFWWIPLLCFAAATAAFMLVGYCFPKGKEAWCGLLFGITAAMLLQGSFLYQDQGIFNGLPYDWRSNLGRIIQNAIIWISLIGMCVLCAYRWRLQSVKAFTAGGAMLLAFLVISGGTLILSSKKEYLRRGECFVSDRDILTISQTQNVIVLVPDMFDCTYMESILTSTPEVTESFRDFTWYRNTAGCFGATNYALGSFLSGGLMLNGEPTYRKTLNANYENDVLFHSLLERDWSVGIYTEEKFIPRKLAEESCNCIETDAAIQDIPAFLSALYRMAACTYAPDMLRPFVWLTGNEFDGLYTVKDGGYDAYTISNISFYERLKTEMFSLVQYPCFRMIHLYGAHYPYITDEDLYPISPSYSDENAVKAARGVLKILEEYLNGLKENGCYDNSIVIIMADHGYSVDGGLTNPLMMIKPAREKKEFAASGVPVSQADLQKTILAALNMPTGKAKGEDILSLGSTRQSKRMYYQMFDATSNGQCRLVEYTVSPEGNARKYFQLTDREILPDGEIRQHSAYCSYCQQNGLEPLDMPNDMSVMH